MKKIILLTCCLCAAGCGTPQPTYDTLVSVLIDKTDVPQAFPTADELSNQFGLEADNEGISIAVSTISDRDINATSIIQLPKDDGLTTSPMLRNAAVQNFKKRIERTLVETKTNERHNHSIIYRAIARQLTRLANTTAKNKLCLVYSDLAEHSEVDFYNGRTIELIRSNPKKVQAMLQATVPLPRLNSVQVWLLYNPTGYEQNNRYMQFAGFFKQMFEGQGAIVHINNTFTLQ